jgi:hypothetical protein
MRQIWLIALLTFVGRVSLIAQEPAQNSKQPPPQSARQALIEMFLGKGENDFAKHLPDVALQSLLHKGETPATSMVLRIGMIGHQMAGEGGHVETFDVGPNVLVSQQDQGNERIEVAVEHDSLIGEEDEIELSVHAYKNGQPEPLPVVPRLIFTLTQEKEVWRLKELTVAAHVPLTDPDYLKGLRKEQDEANETAAQMRATMIAAAETGYSAKHLDSGYTCSLSTLFARAPTAEGSEGGFDPGQASNDWSGYHFALTGCDGTPASKYRLLATPADPDSIGKTFCADESGAVKSMLGEKSTSCFSRGQVVNAPTAPASSEE